MTQENRTDEHPDHGAGVDAYKRATVSKKHTIVVAVSAAVCAALLAAGGTYVFTHTDFSASTANTSEKMAAQFANDVCDTSTTVVASVNQWGSLAAQLGGKCVKVTSLINSTNVEPHDYEPTTSDIATLQNADIVLVNGAGYDEWAVHAANTSKQTVVNVGDIMNVVVDEHDHEHESSTSETESHAETSSESGESSESGHHHHHGSVNPHLWFSPDAILKTEQALEQAMQNKLGTDSKSAATVTKHANEWHNSFAAFASMANKAKTSGTTRTFVASEPVANYLLEYLGEKDITPSAFTNAANSEAEPSPSDIAQTLEQTAKADIVVLNPQEMSGYAKQIQEAAIAHNRTIVNVSEQLPENQATLLDWITSVSKQLLANDVMHGYFLTQDVQDRSLSDYEGQWQSVYPYLRDGSLDTVMKSKAKAAGVSEQKERSYYETGYKTNIATITITGNTMSFTAVDDQDKKTTVQAQYKYDGYKILDYTKGNRGVRYLFTAIGDVPDGAPRFVQFSDHGIAPSKAEHYHIFMGGFADGNAAAAASASVKSQDELLKEMDNWPTYYPASLDSAAIAKEMLAHS